MDYPRIVFMGTPEIAEFILTGLLDNGYPIVGVIAQEDKPVGRKKIIEPVPTKKAALARKIPVFQPHRIRLDYEFVRELKPDLIITCAYGQIIPQELIDIPALGCINVHGSLLPKYRGASPIQQALIHNDRLTGVTILEMTAKMDAGKMLYQKEIAVDDDENYTSLYQKIAVLGLQALLEMLPDYIAGKIQGEEQDESRVTLCKRSAKKRSIYPSVSLAKNLSDTSEACRIGQEVICCTGMKCSRFFARKSQFARSRGTRSDRFDG